jgi:TIR domain
MTAMPRIPRSVFVAHAAEDQVFADLLIKMLGVDGFQAWHEPADSLDADGVPTVVDKGLRETESLVVVLSPAALNAPCLREQVRSFVPGNAAGRVYAVVLESFGDDTPLMNDLKGAVSVNCTLSKLDGLRKLCAAMSARSPALPPELRRVPDPSQSALGLRLLRQLDKLSQSNPTIKPKQPLPAHLRQALLLEIVESFQAPLDRKFRLINPLDGKPTSLPTSVLEELVLDSRGDSHGLETWVPEFFTRAVASRLEEAFRVEPRSIEHKHDKDRTTLAPPPSVQPAQVASLRKFNSLAKSKTATATL